MFYTEEDLKQAYAMGYNEAVDDVNTYIEQDSTEFGLDESYEDDDYSAVEDAIMNETKSWRKEEHDKIIKKGINGRPHFMEKWVADIKHGADEIDNDMRKEDGLKTSKPHYHLKTLDQEKNKYPWD